MGTEIGQNQFKNHVPLSSIQGDVGLFTPTVTQRFRLGTMHEDSHGRKWRYVKNGAAQLEVALLAQSEAVNANVAEIVQDGYTTAIGDTKISALMVTSNGISDHELIDGWMCVNKATGLGYSYPIRDNEWISGDTVIRLDLYDAIRVATEATSELTLVKNPFMDAIVAPTTLTGTILGVPNVVIPVSYYGWVQTGGVCPVYVDNGTTLVIGEMAAYKSADTTVAGACDLQAATDVAIGRVVTIGAADEIALIDLTLD